MLFGDTQASLDPGFEMPEGDEVSTVPDPAALCAEASLHELHTLKSTTEGRLFSVGAEAQSGACVRSEALGEVFRGGHAEAICLRGRAALPCDAGPVVQTDESASAAAPAAAVALVACGSGSAACIWDSRHCPMMLPRVAVAANPAGSSPAEEPRGATVCRRSVRWCVTSTRSEVALAAV